MQIAYQNKKIEGYFQDILCGSKTSGKLQRKVGEKMTRLLRKRCDQLIAAKNFEEYLNLGLGQPHKLEGEAVRYGVHVDANWRLCLFLRVENTDKESLENCDIVYIEGVVDYHGSKENWLIP